MAVYIRNNCETIAKLDGNQGGEEVGSHSCESFRGRSMWVHYHPYSGHVSRSWEGMMDMLSCPSCTESSCSVG